MTPESIGKVDTVKSKLVKAWRQLSQAECNILFFQKLLRKNISTRDIHSFISTQAKLRKVHKGLDKPMSRVAMKAKLNDACAFAVRQRRLVNDFKRKLLFSLGSKKFKHKKVLKQIKLKMMSEKNIQMSLLKL